MVYERATEFPWLFHLYMSNPLAVAVELFHHAFWGSIPGVLAEDPAPANLGWPPEFGWYVAASLGVIVFALVIGQFVFRRAERTFAQDL
jgi:ABC-2 type transport system permease protein